MDSAIYNESLNAVSQSSENLNSSINNLNEFRMRLLGVNSLNELVSEVQKMELPADSYNYIVGLINDENLRNDVSSLKAAIDNYLNEIIEQRTKENKNAEDELDDRQQKIAEDIVDTLNDSGITVTDGVNGIKDKIANGELSGQDIEKIYENAKDVADAYSEKDTNKENAILTADEIVETNTSEQLLGEAEASSEYVSDTPSTVSIDDNGNVLMTGDNSDNSINFTAMMMLLLVTSGFNDGIDLGLNFDAKISKELNQKNKFDIAFGDFKNHANKFNSDIINMFNEQVGQYNPSVDYLSALNAKSPELRATLDLLQNHILGQEGLCKMAIKNSGEAKSVFVRLDENYQEIADCFRQNCDQNEFGNDMNGNSIISMGNSALFTISNTIESLNANKKEKERQQSSLQNTKGNYQLTKDFNREGGNVTGTAANVHTTFLTVIAIAEAVLVGIFTVFLR